MWRRATLYNGHVLGFDIDVALLLASICNRWVIRLRFTGERPIFHNSQTIRSGPYCTDTGATMIRTALDDDDITQAKTSDHNDKDARAKP